VLASRPDGEAARTTRACTSAWGIALALAVSAGVAGATEPTATDSMKAPSTTPATTAAASTSHAHAAPASTAKPASTAQRTTTKPAAKTATAQATTAARPANAGANAATASKATPAAHANTNTNAPAAAKAVTPATHAKANAPAARTPAAASPTAATGAAGPAKATGSGVAARAVSMRSSVTSVSPAADAPVAKPAPAPESAPIDDRVTYQYNALGRRDPFSPLVGGGFVGAEEELAPPDVGGIKVVGIVWGADDKFALVEDPRGGSQVLRTGDKVMNGVVDGLRRDAMIVKLTTESGPELVTIPLTRKGDDSNANH